MKRAATLSVLAAVLLSLLTVVPAQAATAKPRSQCIYMVSQVRHYDQYPHHTFAYVIWDKKGNKIKGIQGGFPSTYERHRLTYQPGKSRAVGKQQNWITGRYHTKTFATVGKGNQLRVKGYMRVSKSKVRTLMNGAPVNQLPGSRCF